MLARSTRHGVEKLDFRQEGTGWRLVLERPGAGERSRPKETMKRYASTDEAWSDLAGYVGEGFKIVLYTE